jgi:uncharacterized protein involved in outer membrane biogenesis
VKKTISIVALALVTLIAGAAIYLYMSFGSLVKSAVETHGPQFTKTRVALGGVNASLFGGSIAINDFLVGNPRGFKTPHAFKVKVVSVSVDRDSITSDVIRIKEIVIEAPDIIYELGSGGSNLETIQKNVTQAAGGPAKPGAKPAESSGDDGPKVVIDNLYVRDSKVALSASFLGGKVVPVPIPEIHLKDIGKDKKGDSKGVTLADAAGKVMDEITGSITKAAKGINIQGLKKGVEGLTKGITGGAKGVTGGAKGTLDDATKGIKGLFGK